MKKIILLLLACMPGIAFSQTPNCCQPAQNTSGLLALAGTAEFERAHEAPEPFLYEDKRGRDISFQTLDGKKGNAYYVPAPEATMRTLILFHEWWGLNDYIRREADRWQDSLGAVDVYAIDLYDRKVATTADVAGTLSSSLNIKRCDNIIQGLLAKIGRDNQIATLGWCMGGSYAYRATVLAEKQAAGCVMYYGFPEKDVKRLNPVQTDVLYIRGTKDKFISADDVENFAAVIREGGRTITIESYDADHAFANPSNPHFDAAASRSAQSKALPFLKKQLAL